MKLLQRYILGELLRVFILLLAALTVMLVFVGLVREQAERGLGAWQLLQILPYVVPSMLPFTIPATLLLAVTVVYGRVAGDLEVTAAKAAGVSPLRLLSPAFALGLLLAGTSYGLMNHAIPWAIGNIELTVTRAMEDIFLNMLAARHNISEPEKGYSITVEDVRDGVLVNPTFCYRKANHEQVTMNAEWATIRFDLEDRVIRLQLKNALANVPGHRRGFRIAEQQFELPMDEQVGHRKPQHLTIADIKQKLADIEDERAVRDLQRDQEAAMLMLTGEFQQLQGDTMKSYANYSPSIEYQQRKLNTEIHRRYAMSGSCLFFVLLGGPFAIHQAKRQFITAFIMCFLPVLLVYYPLMFLMVNLTKSGIDPTWAMWVPNVVLGIAGFVVLRKVIQH